MQSKTCTKCNEEKPISKFYKQKHGKFDVMSICKTCTNQHGKEYYIKNKDKINKRTKQWYKKNKKYHNNLLQLYYVKNKLSILKKQREYEKQNKDKIKERKKKYYKNNIEKINKRNDLYRKNNKEHLKHQSKIYRENHKLEIRKKQRAWRIIQRKTNINFKLKDNLRRRINEKLKNNYKSARTMELIGCSIDFLKKYLESQFKEGMSWENHTVHGWHIDHITPCQKFDLSKPSEQRKCFHYTNLQPLWATENWIKNDK